MHICLSKLIIISSDNGLLPSWCKPLFEFMQKNVNSTLSNKLQQNINQNSYTVGCHYNKVHFNKIFHTTLQWIDQYINQSLLSQKTPHIVS